MTDTLVRDAVTIEDDSRSVASATRRRYPWFGVGKDIIDAATAKDAIVQVGLDWEVELASMHRYKKSTRSYVKVPDRYVSVRTDTDEAIGAVGKSYVPWLNRDAFEFADPLVADGLAEWWAGGELRGGSQIFVVLKFLENFTLVNDVQTELFLMLRSSHDGSKSIQAVVTPIEAGCTNQSALIMRTAPMKWSVGHYRTAQERLETAHQTLKGMNRYATELREMSERLAAIDLEVEAAERVISTVVNSVIPDRPRSGSITDGIMGTLQYSPTVTDSLRATGWGLIEATTEYLDHRRASRSPVARFSAISDGFNAKVRNGVARQLLTHAGFGAL